MTLNVADLGGNIRRCAHKLHLRARLGEAHWDRTSSLTTSRG